MAASKPIVKVLAAVLISGLMAVLLISTRSSQASAGTYYVSPSGNDSNSGTAAGSPFKTIQKAIDLAQPGDTVSLAPGTYLQDALSKRSGLPDAPITITGPADAVVKGGGNARIFEINHDYLTLNGFTIDGLWGSSSEMDGYRDKLLYALGKQTRDGVNGLKLLNMHFKNGGGECVRLRYFARNNEIAFSTFQGCGVHDFKFGAGGKNGEAVYIGTAPEQRGDGKNPTSDPDESNNNWIHHNTFDTQGNECVDIKESATANIVEQNSCTGQKDSESGGFDSRGNGNIFRYNESYGNSGAGIRLGGDTSADGINNEIYGNTIRDNQKGGIKFQRSPQGQICGNTMSGNTGGDAVGTDGARYNPTVTCAIMPPPPPATSVPPSVTATQPPATSVPPTKTSVPATATATRTPTKTSVPATATVTRTPTKTSVPATATATRTPAPQPSVTPTVGSQQSYRAGIDTYINRDSPNSSYAGKQDLKADLTPEMWSLLRFDLPAGTTGRRVLLKLYCNNSSDQGGDIYIVPANWTKSVTWNTRPALGTKVATIGKITNGKWITIDVTSALSQDGVVALAIVPLSKDAAGYRSNEGAKGYEPVLVVER